MLDDLKSAAGYYEDIDMYPHELFSPPDRLIRGAGGEALVGDLEELHFFRSLLPWFQQGRCPMGWVGQWPSGRLPVW